MLTTPAHTIRAFLTTHPGVAPLEPDVDLVELVLREATEGEFRDAIALAEKNGTPLDDASFRLLEQAAA